MPRPEDEAFEEYDDDQARRPEKEHEGSFEESVPRPVRRPREEPDDEDEPPRYRSTETGWLDQQFADTPMPLLILFPLCCGTIALVFGIVGVAACRDPDARRRAVIVLIVSVVQCVLSLVYFFVLMRARRGHLPKPGSVPGGNPARFYSLPTPRLLTPERRWPECDRAAETVRRNLGRVSVAEVAGGRKGGRS
jgi:hypothetical protein